MLSVMIVHGYHILNLQCYILLLNVECIHPTLHNYFVVYVSSTPFTISTFGLQNSSCYEQIMAISRKYLCSLQQESSKTMFTWQ